MQNETNIKKFVISVATGAMSGLIFSLLALLAVSAFVLSGALSDRAAGVVVSIVVAIGASVGGFVAMKRGAYGVLVAGPSVGIFLYIFISLLRMMFFGRITGGEGTFANIVAAIAGGSLGALLASKKRKVRHKMK